jgi:hypothetical protein
MHTSCVCTFLWIRIHAYMWKTSKQMKMSTRTPKHEQKEVHEFYVFSTAFVRTYRKYYHATSKSKAPGFETYDEKIFNRIAFRRIKLCSCSRHSGPRFHRVAVFICGMRTGTLRVTRRLPLQAAQQDKRSLQSYRARNSKCDRRCKTSPHWLLGTRQALASAAHPHASHEKPARTCTLKCQAAGCS